MPALNFQKRFAELVEIGRKNQTIRPLRKDGRNPHEGDRLYLYVGMRTKYCRKLGEGICTEVQQFILEDDGRVIVGTEEIDYFDKEKLAQDDGFNTFDELYEYLKDRIWQNGPTELPFHGLLIKWQNCKTFVCSICREKSDDPEDYTYSISELANPGNPDKE